MRIISELLCAKECIYDRLSTTVYILLFLSVSEVSLHSGLNCKMHVYIPTIQVYVVIFIEKSLPTYLNTGCCEVDAWS